MASYKIFISGPSDVNDFIEIARSTILEINMLTGPLGIQFEPFDWLEMITPGIADEPQAVINEQALGYAAIVAIVGSKIGSPTKEFASGTVEEIEKAIAASEKLPFGSKSVMVFFKDSKIDLKSADLVEAGKIQDLRASLGPKGILFKDFKDEKKFQESLLRSFGIIIAKHFSSKSSKTDEMYSQQSHSAKLTSINTVESDSSTYLDDDEPGLLDLNDMQTLLLEESSDGLRRISDEMSVLTVLMNEKTAELEKSHNDKRKVRQIISDISDRMINLSETVDEEAPGIGEKYSKAIQHMRSLIDLWTSDFNSPDFELQIEELRGALVFLLSSVLEAKRGMDSYMTSIRALPPLTRDINVAKRKLAASNDRYAAVLGDVITETESMLSFVNARNS